MSTFYGNHIGSTYARVLSRESVRIAFLYATLNGLDICGADIRNVYLQAPSPQNDFIFCSTEFGLENVGKVATILCALYGEKSARKDLRNHLRAFPADPVVWMRPEKTIGE